MLYNIRTILGSTALVLTLPVLFSADVKAQGFSLNNDELPIISSEKNTVVEKSVTPEGDVVTTKTTTTVTTAGTDDGAADLFGTKVGVENASNALLAPPPVSTNTVEKTSHEVEADSTQSPSSDQMSSNVSFSPDEDSSSIELQDIPAGADMDQPVNSASAPAPTGDVNNPMAISVEGPLAGGNPSGGINPATGLPIVTNAPKALKVSGDELGDMVLKQAGDVLFSQMSDLERQTTLLTLELRREKIKAEIEAIRAIRRKAEMEEKAAIEKAEREKIEWEQEQQRKMIVEEQKLRELDIAFEKLRQEKILKAYKETMLKENQNWIGNVDQVYAKMTEIEVQRDGLIDDFKKKLVTILQNAQKNVIDSKAAKETHDRIVNDFMTQIAVLKSRLHAAEMEKNADKNNPFGDALDMESLMEAEKKKIKLSEEYTIMEIRGQEDDIVAKLSNKAGNTFMVKKGSFLQSGHRIEEIARTFIRADKNGNKDFIYFAAGGPVEKEPEKEVENQLKETMAEKEAKTAATRAQNAPAPQRTSPRRLLGSRGVPSLNDGMFVK